jgi:iron(III) transport system ATP-binding protein
MMFVEINELHYQYKHAKSATIQDFTLEINKGEIISILGESGSGKSTLLRLIAGLETPDHGSLRIDGKPMLLNFSVIPPEKRGVGMVFQDYALFPNMTVAENIMFGLRKMTRKVKQLRLEEMLALINLEDYKNRYPYELSGGQQQRVALARALAPEPSLLLLDEPFSNLDKNLQERIREELHTILKQTGTTSIFVTHDVEDATAIADRIVYISNGKINHMVTNTRYPKRELRFETKNKLIYNN